MAGPAGRAPRPVGRPEPRDDAPAAPAGRNHFFALLPPPDVRDALAALARRLPNEVGGRPEPAHRLHMTLLFLGALAPGQACREVAGPVDVELDHLGRFARSDVVWAGPSAPPAPALDALHAALRRACAGIPTQRPPGRFSPHVTLLRSVPRDADPPEAPVGPFRWRADRFALLRTDPSEDGRIYTLIASWPMLGGGAG
jgi:2'-5' RNA ligase